MTPTGKIALALALAGLTSVAAPAQMPPGATRVQGKITALSESSATLLKADGTSATVALLPNRTVNLTAPMALDQIAPGSFVATANKSQPDGSGVSTEIRVFPPDAPPTLVNRVMDADTQMVMTNGKVARAVSTGAGRQLTVDYGAGSRQITVPPSIAVVGITPGTPGMVRVGITATVTTFPPMGDRPARQTITFPKADVAGQ